MKYFKDIKKTFIILEIYYFNVIHNTCITNCDIVCNIQILIFYPVHYIMYVIPRVGIVKYLMNYYYLA